MKYSYIFKDGKLSRDFQYSDFLFEPRKDFEENEDFQKRNKLDFYSSRTSRGFFKLEIYSFDRDGQEGLDPKFYDQFYAILELHDGTSRDFFIPDLLSLFDLIKYFDPFFLNGNYQFISCGNSLINKSEILKITPSERGRKYTKDGTEWFDIRAELKDGTIEILGTTDNVGDYIDRLLGEYS